MLMTPKQIAELLGITQQTVTGWCRSGQLEDAEYVNGRWVIRWSYLIMSSLLEVKSKLSTTGDVVPVVGRRRPGRPLGSKNKRPYPKGVKRPRKNQTKAEQ